MLILIILLGFLALVGISLKQDSSEGRLCSPESTTETKINNLQHNNSFNRIGGYVGSSGYATAYLQIIWAFGGFNQANYVRFTFP